MNQGLTKLVVASMIGFSAVSAGWSQRRSSCCSWMMDLAAMPTSKSSVYVQEGNTVLTHGGRFSGGRSSQKNHSATLRAYREAIGDQWKSTVQITFQSKQLALGSIVRSDGWISTKSSEIPDESMDVKLFDGSMASGVVKIRRPDLDLALIKIERDGLPAIRWSTDAEVPLGGWLASADTRSLPLAVGVVSVCNRTVGQERSVLGVQLSAKRSAAYVENIVVGSGAEKAGLQQGDIIEQIDGKDLPTQQSVLDYLSGLPAGHHLTMVVQRDENRVAMQAQMMDLSNSLLDPTEMEVNGSISARSTGFRNVIQHDTVLAPNDCGGPLIDVDGNCVGMNIARAGRICSYALPSKVVASTIQEMLESVSQPTSTDIVEVDTALPGEAAGRAVSTTAASLPAPAIEVQTLKPAVPAAGRERK